MSGWLRTGSPEPAAMREALDETRLMTPFGPLRFFAYEGYERQNSVRTQVCCKSWTANTGWSGHWTLQRRPLPLTSSLVSGGNW
jgi:hypothetical protein